MLNLDITKKNTLTQRVVARVNDKHSYALEVKIYKDSVPVNLTGYTITFEGLNANKKKIIGGSITQTDMKNGAFNYRFPTNSFTVSGKFKEAYFKLEKSGVHDTTQSFEISVLDDIGLNPEEIGDIISLSDEILKEIEKIKQEAVKEAQKAKETAKDALDKAKEAYEHIDNLIKETELDPNKDPEILEARGEYGTLRDRLDRQNDEYITLSEQLDFKNKEVVEARHGEKTLSENVNQMKINIESKTTNISNDMTLNVGDKGDYKTINEALEYVSKFKKTDNSNVEILLQKGFVMREQVVVVQNDLGWITINSVDDVVTVESAKINKVLVENERKPIFFGTKNATLPTIGVLFKYDNQSSLNDGFAVSHNSSLTLLPSAGCLMCGRGIGAYYNSNVSCYIDGLTTGGAGKGAGDKKGVNFEGCLGRAVMATFGSSVNLARANLSNSQGDYAVYCIWGSSVDVYQSNISNSKGTAVMCRDSSSANARETDVSGSKIGYHALHRASINARYKPNNWAGKGAANCLEYAVLASYNSKVECPALPVSNSNTGIHASNSSLVNAIDGVNADGCDVGIWALGASNIDCKGASAKNCKTKAIVSDSVSNVNAEETVVSGSAIGLQATRSSSMNAQSAIATECSKVGVYAFENSNINACYVDATGSLEGFKIARGSTLSVNNNKGGVLSEEVNKIRHTGTIFG